MVNLNYLDGRSNKRLNRVERGTPLGSSAVSRGRTRFIGEESIIVEGSGRVTGTWIVDGILSGEGKVEWTGPAVFDGDVKIRETLDVTADATFQGATTIQNTLDVTAETTLSGATTIENTLDVAAETTLRGDTTVTADLEVLSGGRIKVGDMIFAPTSESGAVGSITSPVALNLKSALTSMSGSAIVDDRLTVVGEIRLPFVGTGTGTPLVVDVFGRIVKQA